MKRIASITLVACLGFSAATAHAFSLFGLGKKKEKEDSSDRRGAGPLPGVDGGEVDLSQPPRMAQEGPAVKPDAGVRAGGGGSMEERESVSGDLPEEVVIKRSGRLSVVKPPLQIEVDAFESIRKSLEPDQALLLAESPLSVVWRRTHPEFLYNDRVIRPELTTFTEGPAVIFDPRSKLSEVMQRAVSQKEAKDYEWSLTIADEEGKVFQHYEGTSHPPEELTWTGQNEQGEWMRAGKAYSPVYMFTDPNRTPFTRVGKVLKFKGVVHQERDGLHLSLDSAEMFGSMKAARTLNASGEELIRSAADLIKRRYAGIPIRVEAYAGTKELAAEQAALIEEKLTMELMLLPQDISTDSLQTPYADQRIEIVLVNR